MRKILFIVLAFFSVITYSQEYTTTTDLNVRDKPNSNSNILKVLNKGEIVSIDSLGVNWSKLTLENGESAYISSKFIEKANTSITSSSEPVDLTILYIVLGVLFIAYIIALVKSRNNRMVAIAGWKDLVLLTVPLIGFVFVMLFGSSKELSEEDKQLILISYAVVSSIALIWSFILSITANKGNVFNIIISILAKMFVILIIILLIFVIFGGSGSKKDGRFKDGTKGNQHTKWKLLIAGIASFTIFTLVKNKEEQNLIYQSSKGTY